MIKEKNVLFYHNNQKKSVSQEVFDKLMKDGFLEVRSEKDSKSASTMKVKFGQWNNVKRILAKTS